MVWLGWCGIRMQAEPPHDARSNKHRRICLSEDDADATKHVAVPTIYTILLLYTYVVHLLVWIINHRRIKLQTTTQESLKVNNGLFSFYASYFI